MAQIDPSIAMSIRPAQIESPLVHAARASELQGAQQSQFMNMLKMKEYGNESRTKNAMMKWLSDKPDLDDDKNINYLATQFGTQGLELAKQIDDRRKARGEAAYRTEQTEDLKSQRVDRGYKLGKTQTDDAIKTISGLANRQQALELLYQSEVNGTIPPEAAQSIRSIIPYDEEKFPAFKQSLIERLASPDARLQADKPISVAAGGRLISRTGEELYAAPDREKESDLARLQRERADIAKTDPNDPRLSQYDAAIAKATATNQPLSDLARKQNELAELEEQLKNDPNNKLLQQRIKEYKDDIRKDTQFRPVTNVSVAAPVTPVTIQDPNDPSKAIVVDARTNKVIGASVKEGPGVDLTARERQAREAKYPQATAAIKTYESKSEQLAEDLEKLANHPGLDGISGAIYGRLPSGTKNSMAAQEIYNSIVARGGFKELADMRASSPTGGALGNVSNQEGQYLRDAFASIGRTQSKDDLAAALIDAAKRVRESKGRIREAYDMTYEYRGNAAPKAPPAPKAPAVGTEKDGYRFKGGNPADQNNWEKVK